MTKKEANELIQYLNSVYIYGGLRKMTKSELMEYIRLFYEMFIRFDKQLVKDAITKVAISSNFFPNFAELNKYVSDALFNRRYEIVKKLIDNLKNNPNDRRNVISLWQDEYVNTAVLPSCVWSSEWDVTDGKLNAWVRQRSCDVPLGLPFNVTQYSVLLCMIARVCGLKPGKIDYSIKDAHIYINQIDGIKEQIKRFDEIGDLKAPTLWLNPEIKDFYDFDNSKDLKDIKIENYNHLGPIKFPIAQ